MFSRLCLSHRVLPPLQTPQQVRPGDETCFPLCYLHNVQHVCQADIQQCSKQRCSLRVCTGAARKHEILFKISVCMRVRVLSVCVCVIS